MRDDVVVKLLEESILPALLKLLQATGQQADQNHKNHIRQLQATKDAMMPTEWQTMLINLDKQLKDNNKTTEALQMLIKAVSPLGDRISELIQTNNELVKSQQEQIVKIDKLLNAFEENTSRLEVLTLATKRRTKDEALGDIYTEIQDRTRD